MDGWMLNVHLLRAETHKLANENRPSHEAFSCGRHGRVPTSKFHLRLRLERRNLGERSSAAELLSQENDCTIFFPLKVFQTDACCCCLGDKRNGGNKADFALVKRRCCRTPRWLSEPSKDPLLNLINNHQTKKNSFFLLFSCPFKLT